MFPREAEYVEHLRGEVGELISTGRHALAYAVELVTQRSATIEPSAIAAEPVRYRMGHAIFSKACKGYRELLHLAEVGGGEGLEMGARSNGT